MALSLETRTRNRHAVEAELRLSPGRGDKVIAAACGVNLKLVRDTRRSLVLSGAIPEVATRVGVNGRSSAVTNVCLPPALRTVTPRVRERRILAGMIQRCTNPKVESYPHYGGRGIAVCARWMQSPDAFIEDMGRAPSPKHTIERIDNGRGYEPGNCRWATMQEQQRHRTNNRLLTLRGETLCAAEWAERYDIDQSLLGSRLKSGWDIEKALTAPTDIEHLECRPRGEQHPAARLTAETVIEIRRAMAAGTTQTALARRLGVARSTVRRAATGACWGHVG